MFLIQAMENGMDESEERHPLDWYPGEEMPPAARQMLGETGAVAWHPAAALLPMMGEAELSELADDIRQHGLRMPITMHEGKILDGRNRWLACERAGIKPSTVTWSGEGGSPALWVISVNVKRRHLSESQRAMIGAGLAKELEKEALEKMAAGGRKSAPGRPAQREKGVADLPHLSPALVSVCSDCDAPISDGHRCPLAHILPNSLVDHVKSGTPVHEATPKPETVQVLPPKTPKTAPKSRDRAASVVGVSPRSVADAKVVAEKAPELAEKVRDGSMSLGAAAHKVRTEAKQAKAAEQVREAPHVDVRLEVADATALPLEDASVDVVCTSPPYGLEKPYHGQDDLAAGWEDFMEDWLREAYRVSRWPGRLILNVPLDTAKGFRPTWPQACAAAIAAGWEYRAAILWDKMNSTKGNRGLGSENSADAPYPVAEVEVVGLFSKGAWKLGDDRPSDITPREWQEWGNGLWRVPGESRGWEGHPAPYPEELIRRLILYLTRVGDTILDPFSGSGTTSLVAWRLKRIPLGFDLSEQYIDSAKRRIAREQERIAREVEALEQPDLGLLAGASR